MKVLEEKTACPNCGFQPLNSSFCPKCGQRKLSDKDFYITSLFQDFFNDIFQFDNAFFKTVKNFLISPGKYAREYNSGSRKKYLSPIKLFLIANAFYFLFPIINTFTTSLSIQEYGIIYNNLTPGLIESTISASGLSNTEFVNVYDKLTTTLSKALLIFIPFSFGIITWLLSISTRITTPILTHLNYSLILNAFMVLIITSVLPGVYVIFLNLFGYTNVAINDTQITSAAFILLNTFGYFLYRNFFGSKLWINIIRTLLLNISFVLILFVYRFLLLLVTLGWLFLSL
ncbi:MAG: DUF3667 domain-containing protein [Balneolaceae bacterium]